MASNAENEVNTMQRIDSYELKLQQSNEEFSQVEERSRNEILSLTKLIDLFKVVPREWSVVEGTGEGVGEGHHERIGVLFG